MSATENPSRLYRVELQGRYPWLRFAPAIETEFIGFLRDSQSRNFVICLWIGLALWLGVAAWDSWRYVYQIRGTVFEAHFLAIVPLARLVTLLALGGLLIGMRRWPRGDWQHVAGLATIAVYSICSFLTGYFYHRVGASHGLSATILILMTVLFPCGITLRHLLPTWIFLLGAYWLAGWLIMPAHQWPEFRATSGLLLICMGMMVFSSILRERGTREQFLLRRLLHWEAAHDPLTGLANRRSFQRHFEVCLAQARREGKALLLVILDLDHFKLYNDHYGHKAGDRALQQVALVLEHYAARPMDMAIRLGGEEFGLLSYADNAQALRQRMEHLRQQLQGLHIIHEHSPTAPCLTVSIGIAMAATSGTTDSLFQQADEQLYQAKKTGRNRVCGPAELAPESASAPVIALA